MTASNILKVNALVQSMQGNKSRPVTQRFLEIYLGWALSLKASGRRGQDNYFLKTTAQYTYHAGVPE